jgi:hypothetical protein
MRKVYLFLLVVCSISSKAQLVAWQFGVPASFGNEVSYNATTNNANLNTSVLSRGSGVFASSLLRAFSADNFTTGGNKANAIANNEYHTFTVGAKPGFSVSLSTLDVKLRRAAATGPIAYIWRYSINGTTFTDIGADISFTSTSSTGVAQAQINLSAIAALQNVPNGTTITFRLYAWGATSAAGSFAIGVNGVGSTANSLAIGGTTASMSPTPVELVSFNGAHNDGKNKLRWVTMTERNNLGFEVQRSNDGISYEKIGFVRAYYPDGNSDEKLTYAFNDYGYTGERQYYRLRQIDIDGKNELSNVIVIYQKKIALITLSAYPNPVTESINLRISSPTNEKTKLEVYDVTGRMVLQQLVELPIGSSNTELNVAALPKGQYFISVGDVKARFIKL